MFEETEGQKIYRLFRAGMNTADIAREARKLCMGIMTESEVDRALSRELEARRVKAQ